MRGFGNRGLALATVLACLAALAVILFAAVSASLAHLNFSNASTNQEHARNLADAAIAEAIDRLDSTNYSFGASGTGDITITIPDLNDAEGRLSFSNSGDFSGRHSFNNLENDGQSIEGFGREVPGRTVHLIGRGRVGKTVRWVECLYYRPPFPDALLATGPIDGRAIHLVGIRSEGDYSGGDISTIDIEDRFPGNLFSNSASGFTSPGPSAEVSQGSIITGSVGSVGAVTVDNTTQVGGELLPGSEARPVPEIDVLGKIALLEPNAIEIANNYSTDVELDPDWYSISNGNLSVNGSMDLRGSALLVKGNLQVSQAITGTGIILVDGDVRIGDGGANVEAGDQVAIGCTGDFDLEASAPEFNYFKGLVYCEGDFSARDITVVGATVVNGKGGAEGSARLENVRYIFNPGAVQLVLQKPAGHEDQNHSVSVSVTIRPSDVEGEYVCDARAYIGFEDNLREDNKLSLPAEWQYNGNDDETDTANTPVMTPLPQGNHTNPNNWYESFENVSLGNPKDANFGLGLQSQIGVWADQIQEDLPVDSRGDWVDAIADLPPPQGFQQYLRDAIQNHNDSEQVSFNLNNLLAESMGSSRILYWRPVRTP